MLAFSLAFLALFASGTVAQGRPGTSTGSVNIGCYGQPVLDAVAMPLTSGATCVDACQQANYLYSWSQPSTGDCQCSNYAYPNPNANGNTFGLQQTGVVPNCDPTATDTGFNCQMCANNLWRLSKVTTTFIPTSRYICFNFNDVGLPLSQYTDSAGAPPCFNTCAKSAYVYIYANPNTNKWQCACSNQNLVDGVTGTGCGAGAVFAYVHSLPAQASGLARRREIEARASRTQSGPCPAGLTACQVPGEDAYECLDTQRELGSCGGCVYGAYGNSTATAGYDCERFGPKDTVHTCVNGKCVLQGCRRGKTLRNGICV